MGHVECDETKFKQGDSRRGSQGICKVDAPAKSFGPHLYWFGSCQPHAVSVVDI